MNQDDVLSPEGKVARYETFAEPLTAQYVPAAFSMVGGIFKGMRVLDVAAGTGALSVRAAESGAHVLAIDMAPQMVARLAERLECFPDCRARVMDGQALEVPDGDFDAAFSLFGVGNFPDWRRGLRELARVITGSGCAAIGVWTDPNMTGPNIFLSKALASTFSDKALPPPPPGAVSLSSVSTLAEEMREAGFQKVKVETVAGVWSTPSVEAFLAEREVHYGFTPTYMHLTQEDRDRILPALRDACEAHLTKSGVQVISTALIAVGSLT